MLPGPRNEEEKVAVGGEETAGEERVAWSEQQEGVTRSGLQDYLTLFRMMSPAFAGSSLASAEEYCRSPDCTKSECLALSFSRHCGPVLVCALNDPLCSQRTTYRNSGTRLLGLHLFHRGGATGSSNCALQQSLLP